MDSVALLMITDGRRDAFERTVASMSKYLGIHRLDRIVTINDCLDPEYALWLDAFVGPLGKVHHVAIEAGEKQGFSGAIQHGWAALKGFQGFIFHLEEDFLFEEQVPLREMIAILKGNENLAQVALVRNPVSGEEHAAGGLIEKSPHTYRQKEHEGIPYLEHNNWFTTNPCVYRSGLIQFGWPDGPDSEEKFGNMFQQGVHGLPWMDFAYYGRFGDKPRCFHIGQRTADWKP